jgi:hypothetical protein
VSAWRLILHPNSKERDIANLCLTCLIDGGFG